MFPSEALTRVGTNGFLYLHILNGCLIVSFLFLLMYGFIKPRMSAPKKGDNITALLM